MVGLSCAFLSGGNVGCFAWQLLRQSLELYSVPVDAKRYIIGKVGALKIIDNMLMSSRDAKDHNR